MSLTFVKTVSRITGQGNLLAVSDQVTWIKGVGMHLIIVTKKKHQNRASQERRLFPVRQFPTFRIHPWHILLS